MTAEPEPNRPITELDRTRAERDSFERQTVIAANLLAIQRKAAADSRAELLRLVAEWRALACWVERPPEDYGLVKRTDAILAKEYK